MEKLTEANLELQDRAQSLERTVEELEELREVSEELERDREEELQNLSKVKGKKIQFNFNLVVCFKFSCFLSLF